MRITCGAAQFHLFLLLARPPLIPDQVPEQQPSSGIRESGSFASLLPPHTLTRDTRLSLSSPSAMAQKFRDQVNMGIRAAKAGMPGPVNPMNPAFLHMYMPLLDGRFPYNIGPVELAALAMANNFPNVLMGNNHHNNQSNGSGPAVGDSYQQSERANRLSSGGGGGRSSSSPGTTVINNNNSSSSSKCSAHSRNSASSSSPVSSSPGHLSQAQVTRRSFPSSCHAEEARRKEETGKKAAATRSDDAPLNLSKPRGSHSRSSPLVQCPASPSPGGQHRQQPSPSPHHPAQHHQPASPLSGLRSHPMLSPSVAGKFPAWQPSPLFAPGFYSAPPFIPYSRPLPNGAPSDSPHDKPFPFGMFPAGLDGLPGFPAAGQSASHHNNGSKKESPGSAGSVGGFSDSSNLDSEKKEDTVVTCQSEYLLRVS